MVSRTLTDETLSTFTWNIESQMNSGPLKTPSNCILDPLHLTTNLGYTSIRFPCGDFSKTKIEISSLQGNKGVPNGLNYVSI